MQMLLMVFAMFLGFLESALATDPDYTVITSAVAVGGIVVAILGMAAIKIGPNVARWAGNKLANFF